MSWIDDLERRVGLTDEPIRTDKIREVVARMPDIDRSILSPALQAQLADVDKALEDLAVVLDEYDADDET